MISDEYKGGNKSQICYSPKGIENYVEAINDKMWMWECHHRDEHEKRMTMAELKRNNQYYNLPPNKLIFLPRLIHSLTHYLGYIPDKKYWYIWLNPPFVNLPTKKLGDIIDIMSNAPYGKVRTLNQTYTTKFSHAVELQEKISLAGN